MELRFEAWNTELKVMHKVGDDYGTTSYLDCINYLKQGQPVIIRQWTGLTDSQGTDIYADDICRVEGLGNCVVDVCPYFGAQFDDYNGNHSPVVDSDAEQDLYEVIGNIHQQPELMESDDE